MRSNLRWCCDVFEITSGTAISSASSSSLMLTTALSPNRCVARPMDEEEGLRFAKPFSRPQAPSPVPFERLVLPSEPGSETFVKVRQQLRQLRWIETPIILPPPLKDRIEYSGYISQRKRRGRQGPSVDVYIGLLAPFTCQAFNDKQSAYSTTKTPQGQRR